MANGSIADTYDNQHDVPRPDGYLPIPDWQSPTATTMPIGSGLNGYTGKSPRAARSDHVHPCNISPIEPEKIGLPRWLNKDYSTMFQTSWDGIYGSTGTLDGTNRYSNMYSLSNHVHAYGFVQPTLSSAGTMDDKSYCSLPDGKELDFGLKYASRETTPGVFEGFATPINDNPLSDSSWSSLGFQGRLPFPAHADHSHPLNLIEVHSSGATGDAVKDYVKPIDFDPTKSESGYGASYGTENWYARVDHVHALPTGGTGATGIGADGSFGKTGNSYPNPIPVQDASIENYGTSNYATTWERDSTGNTDGFKINVVCAVGRMGQSTSGRPILFMRTLTFDKYGICRSVSAAEKGCML